MICIPYFEPVNRYKRVSILRVPMFSSHQNDNEIYYTEVLRPNIKGVEWFVSRYNSAASMYEFICVCIYLCTFVYIYLYMHVCMHLCIYENIHGCMYLLCMHLSMFLCIHGWSESIGFCFHRGNSTGKVGVWNQLKSNVEHIVQVSSTNKHTRSMLSAFEFGLRARERKGT